jgi:cytochrome c556
MLAGMRQYLKSVEGVLLGMARNDMKAVAQSARKAGMAMVSDVSFEAALSVPSDFALRSMETHQLFDLVADEARDIGTKLAVTKRLGEAVATCNSCHAMYRLSGR